MRGHEPRSQCQTLRARGAMIGESAIPRTKPMSNFEGRESLQRGKLASPIEANLEYTRRVVARNEPKSGRVGSEMRCVESSQFSIWFALRDGMGRLEGRTPHCIRPPQPLSSLA